MLRGFAAVITLALAAGALGGCAAPATKAVALASHDSFIIPDELINKFTDILDGVRRDIIFILATRDVENIDRAVPYRCEQLQFSLPDAECRREFLLSYFDEHVRSFIDANNEGAPSLLPRLTRTLT